MLPTEPKDDVDYIASTHGEEPQSTQAEIPQSTHLYDPQIVYGDGEEVNSDCEDEVLCDAVAARKAFRIDDILNSETDITLANKDALANALEAQQEFNKERNVLNNDNGSGDKLAENEYHNIETDLAEFANTLNKF